MLACMRRRVRDCFSYCNRTALFSFKTKLLAGCRPRFLLLAVAAYGVRALTLDSHLPTSEGMLEIFI